MGKEYVGEEEINELVEKLKLYIDNSITDVIKAMGTVSVNIFFVEANPSKSIDGTTIYTDTREYHINSYTSSDSDAICSIKTYETPWSLTSGGTAISVNNIVRARYLTPTTYFTYLCHFLEEGNTSIGSNDNRRYVTIHTGTLETTSNTIYWPITPSVNDLDLSLVNGDPLGINIVCVESNICDHISKQESSYILGTTYWFNESVETTIARIQNGEFDEAGDFATDSWETISQRSENGTAERYYQIGNTRTIELTTGEEVQVRIIGFNHDTLASGGTAGISIEMVDLLSTTYQYNSSNTNSGGWDASLLRSTLNSDVFATLPSDLQAVIKSVKKKTSTGYGATGVVDSEDKLWVVSMAEVFSQSAISNSAWSTIKNYADIYTQEGSQYEFYKNLIGDTDPNDVISDLQKKRNGSNYYWWLRSPCLNDSSCVWCYYYYYEYVTSYYAYGSNGVALGFCI